MRANGVIQIMPDAAIGARDLRNAVGLFRVQFAQQIKLQLFAALAAQNIHIQRAGQKLREASEQGAVLSLLQL